jgi:hypothetical protein
MKTKNLPMISLAALAILSFTACGKTSRDSTSTDSATTSPIGGTTPPGTSTFTSIGTTTTTSTSTGQAPLTFNITLNGNQNAITPSFSTDNVLKVKFTPGTTQGNSFHSASELAVTLTLNGLTFTPQYTASNYTYGQVGETSNVIDLSSHVSQGSTIQLGVISPKSDYYCTYSPNPFYYTTGYDASGQPIQAPTNPLYNSYPGCRKAVFSNHQWSGTITVQTSSTSAI